MPCLASGKGNSVFVHAGSCKDGKGISGGESSHAAFCCPMPDTLSPPGLNHGDRLLEETCCRNAVVGDGERLLWLSVRLMDRCRRPRPPSLFALLPPPPPSADLLNEILVSNFVSVFLSLVRTLLSSERKSSTVPVCNVRAFSSVLMAASRCWSFSAISCNCCAWLACI